MTALLEATGLSLPGRLRATDVRLEAGTIACLIGLNGSGKTSLLHALAGIGAPGGTVRIDGSEPGRAAPADRPRLLSFMPASRDVRWPLAARELVALGGADEGAIDTALRHLELQGLAGRRVDRLSTGERSRVLLARAMASRPRLLLLDEPFANLDPQWQLRLEDLLRSSVRRNAQAALVAVHDLDTAARIADRLIVMSDGRIAADGPPDRLLASEAMPRLFGVARAHDGGWRLASAPAGPQSSQ